jgi:hypothetical protein
VAEETLTEDERRTLSSGGYYAASSITTAKALRVIDAQAARIAEQEAMGKGVIGGLVEQRDAANARAEAAGLTANEFGLEADKLESEAAALRALLDQERCERINMEEHESKEVSSLRAEVERLTKMLDVCSSVHGHNVKLKSSLADARALLVRVKADDSMPENLADDIDAFLAAAPESPRAPIERHPVRHIPEDQLVPVELPRAATELARPTFEEVWAEKERQGYQYGHDALEQVRFGWELCMAEIERRAVKP